MAGTLLVLLKESCCILPIWESLSMVEWWLRWMSSECVHSQYLFDNCFEVLCVVYRRVEITWGCHWLSKSCSEVVLELHQHIHALWHSHNHIVRLVGMQSSYVVLPSSCIHAVELKSVKLPFFRNASMENIMFMQAWKCMKWHTSPDVLSAGPGECCILHYHGY